MREPYPLQWPATWKRTESYKRTAPKFSSQFARDRDAVIRQLKRRGGNVVITSDLPTRNDGLPYANASCTDPGVAVGGSSGDTSACSPAIAGAGRRQPARDRHDARCLARARPLGRP